MTNSKQSKPSYQVLKAELDDIMAELGREDLDIDQALKHYQRGIELINQLELHLKTAENKIQELQAKLKTSKGS
ncbi:MAG: exodeoxyribonuclease VII small subunit [Patescibacteria group bacterium]|mgnify:CR=1 FL=1